MTRILFVDDEPLVLRGIERAGRVRRAPWEARFASGGEAALAVLAREPIDIIVSDLNMPDMDGVVLLGSVRQSYPHITRLALSGECATAASLHAVRVVHQWISKPCDLSALFLMIEQLCWARSLVDDPAVVAQTSELSSLPSPPRLFLRVNEALTRSAPLREIVALIETDPAVTAKLLQLVNSAFFGEATRVTEIRRAAMLVGTDTLRGLLLGAEVFRSSTGTEVLASHSLFVAHLARRLAPSGVAGDAFVAGILHDLGELVIAAMPPSPDPSPMLHARAAALLLGLWGLPPELVTAVAFHHDPAGAPSPADPTLRALALAELLTAELEAPDEVSPVPHELATPSELAEHRRLARDAWQKR